ncbi:MAG TPA: hypothetical protein VG994_01750 [Steroidobacteraceae bacterium]|nr:hypothetical protein [Steroidobacteraceae bacterium]
MSRIRAIWVAGWALLAAIVGVGTVSAAELPLAIPKGGRIGIIDMMTPDVTHFHVGASQVKSFLRTYRASWSVADVIDEPLIWSLTNLGLEPVSLQPSELLRRQKQSWIMSNPQGTKLPRGCLEELQRVIMEESLSALILIAPGPNSDPESVEGNRLKKLPEYIQGWGFSTSDEPGGVVKPVVFNLTQMLVVQKTTDGVRLEHREWGGSYVYEWADFTPPTDLKTLPDAEIAKLKPVFADIMKRQIARVTPVLQP